MLDVLIAGAGPTGLTLAIELRRRGIGVRLVDPLPGPAQASRGKGLQPRTLELFDKLGVIDAVLAEARPYPPIRTYAGDRIVDERHMHEPHPVTTAEPYPNIMMLPQWRTEEILVDHLVALGGRPERGVALSGFTQDDEGVSVSLSTGETVRTRYLVGADGGHSMVRRTAGIALAGDTPTLARIAVADVEASGLDRDHWHAWALSPTAFVSLCPLPATTAFQMTASLPANADPELTLELLQHLLTERSGRDDVRLANLTWASLYRPNIRMAERFRLGRVFIAGDAAHVHPPAGGQGLNTGVQDAVNLAWKLAAVLTGAPDALLDSYEAERLPIAAHVLGLSGTLLRRGLAGDPEALKRGGDERQLAVTYRGSPLAEGKGAGELQPGDRIPDGVLPDGRRIFEVLRHPGFTILDGPAVTVVRPDGYIGGIFGNRAAAEAYVARLTGM